jgi:hypothetical protein
MQAAAQNQDFVPAAMQSASVSRTKLWAGGTLSVLAILFLLMDAVMHLLKPAPVIQAFARLGYPLRLAVPLGILELVCIALYAVPRSSVLGAIVLTGYLGGAVATHVRAGSTLFEMVFPILIGGIVWAGILLREERLRAIFPLRS